MADATHRKVLVAVDGSEQSLDAVRYVGNLLAPQQVEVVLFHVMTKVPESFWDIEKGPEFQYNIVNIQAWESQQQQMIDEFMTQATRVLSDAGVLHERILVRITERKAGIARDIMAEAQEGYDAVVAGRKGLSELKDLVIGSIATKLVEKLVNVPIWLIGGKQTGKKILVSMDSSEGAMLALRYVTDMLRGRSGVEVALFHAVRGFDIFHQVLGKSFVPIHDKDWVDQARVELESAAKEMGPVFDEGHALLTAAGVVSHREAYRIVKGVSSRAGAIVEEARRGDYDTIVVGRRGLSKVQEFFMGRVSNKVIQLAKERTVWVVS